MRRAIAATAAVCCAGCQVYTPTDLSGWRQGEEVRVNLTDMGMMHAAAQVGPRASSVEGHVAEVTDSSIVLHVEDLTRLSGSDEPWNGESVTIARSDVASVETRKTSVVKSVLVGGGIIAAVIFAGRAFGGGGDAAGGAGGSTQKPPK